MLFARRGITTRSSFSRSICLRLLWACAALVFLAPKRSTKRDELGDLLVELRVLRLELFAPQLLLLEVAGEAARRTTVKRPCSSSRISVATRSRNTRSCETRRPGRRGSPRGSPRATPSPAGRGGWSARRGTARSGRSAAARRAPRACASRPRTPPAGGPGRRREKPSPRQHASSLGLERVLVVQIEVVLQLAGPLEQRRAAPDRRPRSRRGARAARPARPRMSSTWRWASSARSSTVPSKRLGGLLGQVAEAAAAGQHPGAGRRGRARRAPPAAAWSCRRRWGRPARSGRRVRSPSRAR